MGLKTSTIRELLQEASLYIDQGLVHGLRFSTRPDTITPKRIDLLRGYPVATVEIGAQSMSDTVLNCSQRGHNAADTARAIDLLKTAGYRTGIQLMVGLPEETREDVEITARATAALAPDLARIYPTLVLADSLLARWYTQGRFTPIDLNEAVLRTKRLFSHFYRAGIQVIRMGLQASEDLSQPSSVLAGPYHPAFGQLVLSALFLDAITTTIKKKGLRERQLVLRVNPRSESTLRGQKNYNLKFLRGRYGLASVSVVGDKSLAGQEICVNGLNIDIHRTIGES